ncbi:MAG: hypothetical protein ABIP55_02135 [Tepidisphaeraceae bacterium]
MQRIISQARRAAGEYGFKAVQSPDNGSDLHATILKQMSLDRKKMQFRS